VVQPNVTNHIPLNFLHNYSTPCWAAEAGQLQCIPAFYILGPPSSGAYQLWSMLQQHPNISKVIRRRMAVCGTCSWQKQCWYGCGGIHSTRHPGLTHPGDSVPHKHVYLCCRQHTDAVLVAVGLLQTAYTGEWWTNPHLWDPVPWQCPAWQEELRPAVNAVAPHPHLLMAGVSDLPFSYYAAHSECEPVASKHKVQSCYDAQMKLQCVASHCPFPLHILY
jgi:hypothetical protein